jgi:hypothetical protein
MPATYAEQLHAVKQQYPFNHWRQYWQQPDEREDCNRIEQAYDALIEGLAELGPEAPTTWKIDLFEQTIAITNDHAGVIETGEREDLCELTNAVSLAAGLNPADYGDGEGLASEWREW